MIKLSSMTIDYYDSLSIIEKELSTAPDFVKNASIIDKSLHYKIPDEMYAVNMITKTGSRHRKYPLFDKAHVWMSNKSFEKTAYSIPYKAAITAATNIKHACLRMGVMPSDLVVKIAEKSGAVNPDVKVDEKADVTISSQINNNPPVTIRYAVHSKSPDGKPMYPLDSKLNVEKAVKYLVSNMNTMPNDVVKEFAENLAEAARLYKVSVPDNILNIATGKTGSKSFVNIMSRKNLTVDPKIKGAIEDIARKSKVMPAEKTASLLRDIDNLIGIKKYSSKVKCPYMAISEDWIGITEKVAESKKAKININGVFNEIDLEKFISENYHTLLEKLPKDVVDKMVVDPVDGYNSLSEVQKNVISEEMSK